MIDFKWFIPESTLNINFNISVPTYNATKKISKKNYPLFHLSLQVILGFIKKLFYTNQKRNT